MLDIIWSAIGWVISGIAHLLFPNWLGKIGTEEDPLPRWAWVVIFVVVFIVLMLVFMVLRDWYESL